MSGNDAATLSVSKRYKKQSALGEIWHRLKRNKGAVMGLVIFFIFVIIALYSSFFVDYNTQVTAIDPSNAYKPPSSEHFFGTDNMGRDLFYRVLYGTRYSLVIGLFSVGFALVVGIILGSIAGFYGGRTEDIIMRASDILASIPGLLLGMCIVTVLGTNLFNLVFAVGVHSIPEFIRVTRGSVLLVRNQEFVESATAIGYGSLKTLFTQVVPNGLSPIIVTYTCRIGSAIIEAASLSFLGFGVPVPTPEWGALISDGRNYLRMAPFLTYFPGIFIMIAVLAFNILGDGLRDALDPKLKR
ncbi:MAG: ABC transporter permease [Synergistaceae bacterium]|jgi:peptide/nickel transport system permease protein|nr:ABC transporter permease [Synergistaceae bacterium]